MVYNKKILYPGILVILLIIIVGIILTSNKKEDIYKTPQPEEVVRQYFTSWNNKDYPDMYAAISDGFKKIEPTAKDLSSFRAYASSQGIEGIIIKNIKEKSNDGITSEVDYEIKLVLGEGVEGNEKIDEKKSFSGTFTLKYRQADVIPGWKLIHPYGNNIDKA